MNRIPVWIDCDPGVDDAVAILLANWLPELDIVGISTVAGNATLPITTENALKICNLMKKNYPVFSGADRPLMREYEAGESFHGPDGLGGARLQEPSRRAESLPAWDAIYEAARQSEGRLELVTLGPLTNIAIALGKYPELPRYLRRIVLMGGSATRGNCTPAAEFNIHADPEAAQAVFRSPVEKVMCGLEVTEQAYLTAGELAAITAHDSAVCRFLREATPMLQEKNTAAGLPGWAVHDACPVAYIAHPELFSGREAGVFVETRAELTFGKTVTDLYSDKKFEEKNTFVVLDIDRPAFAALLKHAVTQS